MGKVDAKRDLDTFSTLPGNERFSVDVESRNGSHLKARSVYVQGRPRQYTIVIVIKRS